MQIPTSPPLVGHNPRRNIALSLNWDPPIETGFPLRSELTNLQIGRVHFRREDLCPFLSSDYIQTSIWVPGLCRACRIPRNVKKKIFLGTSSRCNANLICSEQPHCEFAQARERGAGADIINLSCPQLLFGKMSIGQGFILDLRSLTSSWSPSFASGLTDADNQCKSKSQAWAGVVLNQD